MSARPISVRIIPFVALALLAPALARAQPRPPAAAPAAGVDPEVVRALERRITELEAREAAVAKKVEDDKKADADRAVATAKLLADIKAETEARRAEEAKKKAEDDRKAAEDKVSYEGAVTAPFGFADFSWVPGNYGSSDRPFKVGPFTGEFRADTVYHYDFSHPKDDTISGSSEAFRSNELQVTQLGFGGDFFYKGMMGRMMTQFGMYSTTTPGSDASPSKGQWDLADAYRYLSEAYGGYHVDAMHGVNVEAGIFTSYMGLWSYYNFDNWTYQPSYASSNMPLFFDGVRVQFFPSEKLKIEPWLVNGWQSYGKFNQAPGFGLEVLYRPNGALSMLGNQYIGTDTLGTPGRKRVHTDDSIMAKYFDDKGGALSKAAASLTVDAGCEFGAGDAEAGTPAVTCGKQAFLGFMVYNRLWFFDDHFGLTVGGGAITNPGRYLVPLPPINGATASTGSPYFTENPGDKYQAWDMQITGDWMPTQFTTFRVEYNHRAASVPYFSGPQGVTPPGGNTGDPATLVKSWQPDLVKTENRMTFALMVKL
jgi:hypothetical protein